MTSKTFTKAVALLLVSCLLSETSTAALSTESRGPSQVLLSARYSLLRTDLSFSSQALAPASALPSIALPGPIKPTQEAAALAGHTLPAVPAETAKDGSSDEFTHEELVIKTVCNRLGVPLPMRADDRRRYAYERRAYALDFGNGALVVLHVFPDHLEIGFPGSRALRHGNEIYSFVAILAKALNEPFYSDPIDTSIDKLYFAPSQSALSPGAQHAWNALVSKGWATINRDRNRYEAYLAKIPALDELQAATDAFVPRANLFGKGHPLHAWTLLIETVLIAVIMLIPMLYADAWFSRPHQIADHVLAHILGYMAGIVLSGVLLALGHWPRYQWREVVKLVRPLMDFAYRFWIPLLALVAGDLFLNLDYRWILYAFCGASFFSAILAFDAHEEFHNSRRDAEGDKSNQKAPRLILASVIFAFAWLFGPGAIHEKIHDIIGLVDWFLHLGPIRLNLPVENYFDALGQVLTSGIFAIVASWIGQKSEQAPESSETKKLVYLGSAILLGILSLLPVGTAIENLTDTLGLMPAESIAAVMTLVLSLVALPLLIEAPKAIWKAHYKVMMGSYSVPVLLSLQWWFGLFDSKVSPSIRGLHHLVEAIPPFSPVNVVQSIGAVVIAILLIPWMGKRGGVGKLREAA